LTVIKKRAADDKLTIVKAERGVLAAKWPAFLVKCNLL